MALSEKVKGIVAAKVIGFHSLDAWIIELADEVSAAVGEECAQIVTDSDLIPLSGYYSYDDGRATLRQAADSIRERFAPKKEGAE